MKRPKQLLARADDGTQVVILEIEADAPGEQPKVRYELANRSEVTRISDTEFVVLQSGTVLTLQRKGYAAGRHGTRKEERRGAGCDRRVSACDRRTQWREFGRERRKADRRLSPGL